MRKGHSPRMALESLESRRLLAGVTTSLALYDMSSGNGQPIAPSSPGVWNLAQGTQFRVVVSATVNSPNLTNASRSTVSLRNQPLGLANLDTDIVSSGTNIVNPVGDSSTSPPRWVGYTDLTPDGFAFPFSNLIDRGSDGDLDPTGMGMFSTNFSLTSANALSKFEYGAATSGADAGPMQIVLGDYIATNAGTTQLTTAIQAANVYADENPDTTLTGPSVPSSNWVNGSITVNVAPTPATVSGRVFNDKNADGIFDGNDTGISGFRVFLDQNDNGILDSGEISKPVSGTGTYTFTGVAPGTYRVQEVFRSGWRQTFPALGYYQVTLRSGDAAKSLSFANTDTVLIKGRVFMDANKDGAISSGEAGLPSWRLFLDANNNGVLDSGETSTLSDASGNYRFFNMPAGTYVVRIVQQAKYKQTSPGSKSYTLTLSAAGTTSNKNFGEKRST